MTNQVVKQEFSLKPFVQSEDFPFEVVAKVVISSDKINLSYEIKGDIKKIGIPKIKENPQRVIGLWNSTCFEFFLKTKHRNEYLEFNFSPSYDWNCFHFLENSNDLKEWKKISDIELDLETTTNSISMIAKINKKNLPRTLIIPSELFFSTTAVLVFDGKPTYWAIKHTDNKPNFHHPESFIKLI